MWATGTVADHEQSTKVIEHPEVGRVELDCDVLATQRGDLRVVVYTARPGSDAQTRLDLLGAIGTQAMS